MRFYKLKAIACALSLAMATSMALPIGAFAAVDDSGQTQHEQKTVDTDNGVDVGVGVDRTEDADKEASQDIDSGFVGDANEGGRPEGHSEEGGEPGEQQPGENLGGEEFGEGKADSIYKVSTSEELVSAQEAIAAAEGTEATIVLKADVTVSGGSSLSSFGVNGKRITIKSDEGKLHKLSFDGRAVLNGDCTFDNVDVRGSWMYCNGHDTEFTENGQIHLSYTLYGGGYMTTVSSTHVVIAASGYINPSSSSGLHDVIGGSYKGSVEGDTYLEITGDIKMQGGNHINPGCMKGDGSSGDGSGVPNVYVGGNATLVYDNKNADTYPAIEGTYGCEMRGNVTLDVRAGGVLGIVGAEEPLEDSIIRGDLHIIAGSQAYENTDRILRLGGNWPIVGAGNSFATMPGVSGNYVIGGNITIDSYENVWGWDKGTTPDSYDLPEIYGAIRGTVGGSIAINAHGSHVQNIFGASDSNVSGAVTVTATDVELRNSEYGTDYDEGYVFGLWEKGTPATANGPVTINVNGGDVGLVMATDQTTVPAGSSINVTGKPNIRTGIRGTQASSYSTAFPVANISACEATIPFIKMMSQVNVAGDSKVIAHIMSSDAGLNIEENSVLTTDEGQVWIWGDAVVDGTWEQQHHQVANYNDIFVSGKTTVGPKGRLINQGLSNLKGNVSNDGMMALMGPALLQGDYVAGNAELRLPAVADNYDGTDDGGLIPVTIKGISSGTTIVNTVNPGNWEELQCPKLGDNYILSKKFDAAETASEAAEGPDQGVFVLGNSDATSKGWYLKRLKDAAGDTGKFMWQVAKDTPPTPEPPAKPEPSVPPVPEPPATHEPLATPEPPESTATVTSSELPQTGDATNTLLWSAAALISALVGAALLIIGRKKKYSE